MQPLIDADVLRYEVGYAAEAGWQLPGVPTWDYVEKILHERIDNICAMVNATMPPILYLTGKDNFRYSIARKRPYKERPGLKPYHYKNLTAYINAVYDARLVEGLEADDLMSIEQTKRPGETIICTRDKDLRQVPGWHYGWELGDQPSFGPLKVEGIGLIELETKINAKGVKTNKIRGYGDLFFYSQILTGDVVDTVPGLPGCGPAKAFEILFGSESTQEAFNRVVGAYRGFYGDNWEAELLEQGRLLYMIRELNEDGSPKMWEFPK